MRFKPLPNHTCHVWLVVWFRVPGDLLPRCVTGNTPIMSRDYHWWENLGPNDEDRVEGFAKDCGLNEAHAAKILEENALINANLPVYIKISDTTRFSLENGEMTIYYHTNNL